MLQLLLDEGEQPVQELADHFEMRRPSISEHLKVLKDAGLVQEQRRGRQRYYRLEAAPLLQVHAWLAPYEQFWQEKLTNLRTLLDEVEDDDTRG